MRQDLIKELIKEARVVSNLRDTETKIIAKSKGMRQRNVKPMADKLERMQNTLQDKLNEELKPEINAILTKLGYEDEPQYLKDSIANIITYNVITMLETHVVQLRTNTLTQEQRTEIARLLKEVK